MFRTLIASTLVLSLASCSLWSKDVQPVVNEVIDCAKAEAQSVTAGKSVIEIVVEVATQLGEALAAASAAGADLVTAVETAAEQLITQYGEPIVACVMKDIDPATGSGSGSAMLAKPLDPIQTVITKHNWHFAK